MNSIVLQTAARFLLPLLLLYAVFLLVRGHNQPGGGFVAGLVASAAVLLYALAFEPAAARRILPLGPPALLGTGLLLAAASGMAGLAAGAPFLTGLWIDIPFASDRSLVLGTPLLFDVGVCLVVLGAVTGSLLALAEEEP